MASATFITSLGATNMRTACANQAKKRTMCTFFCGWNGRSRLGARSQESLLLARAAWVRLRRGRGLSCFGENAEIDHEY